jgi:hypothetical protein
MANITLKEFIQQVNKTLIHSNIDLLKHFILTQAKSLNPNLRETFLIELKNIIENCEQFNNSDKVKLTEDQSTANQRAQDNEDAEDLNDITLLEELDDFLNDIKDEEYYDGWAWDHDILDERIFGDDSWISEFNEFAVRADKLFFNMNFKTAAEAYEKLFNVLLVSEEGHYLVEEDHSQLSIEIDYPEFVARYIRSVYLSTKRENRFKEISNIIKENHYVTTDFSIKELLECDITELPDFQEFLETLINELSKSNSLDSVGWIRRNMATELIIEAKEYLNGIAGLEEYAVSHGKVNPEIYLKLIIEMEKRLGDATDQSTINNIIETTKKALDEISINFKLRAKIADCLVSLGKKFNDKKSVFLGLVEGYKSDPCETRLIDLYPYLTMLSDRDEMSSDETITELIERTKNVIEFDSSLNYQDQQAPSSSLKLYTTILVLAGKLSEAYAVCKDTDIVGWSYSDNPSGFFVPFLLKLLSKTTERTFLDELMLTNDFRFSIDLQFLEIINKIITETDLKATETKKYTTWCDKIITKRADHIIQNKFRKSYSKVAKLLLGLSQVYKYQNNEAKAIDLVTLFQRKYNRHIAFQKELKKLKL